MALLAFHSKCLRLLQISGAGKSLVVMTLNTPLLPLSINARWKMKHLISPSFSLPRVFRHSPSSLCALRLHQTSYASSSSPSNGCFLLPAPTYGSSMSGTQVSPSCFFFLLCFSLLAAKWPLSPQILSAQEIQSCQVSSLLT